MMTNNKHDKEVYILGSESGNGKKKEPKRNLTVWIGIAAILFLLTLAIVLLLNRKEQTPEYYFEPEQTAQTEQQSISVNATEHTQDTVKRPYTEVSEETAGHVPLVIYTVHNATMSLAVGMPDKSDPTIVLAAMAADIRKDNMQIVGDFVLSGKRLARGVAKKGYVAVIDHKITIGIGETTPLLQQAMDNKGFFFRQYPLVSNGEPIKNNPKNSSIRRALAIRDERVVIIESKNRESFHDFSQALIDIGVSDAIYLVGGDAFGWYYDHTHVRKEFGKELTDIPDNISYIVWR
ncbi:hypothetical protein LJC72_12335 [Bacteroides sp. OttesenSCG-928-D19]|nr:hypothetical protein [Bacteroides sp. OttesenSCG-928-D19]